MTKELKGVYIPITTPFHPDGALASEHLRANVERYAATPLDGYLVMGSNGENKSLTRKEKRQVVQAVCTHRRPDQVVMVGSIYESTAQTIDFAREAIELGADYITLLPPCYFKKDMTDPVLTRYFTDVANAVDKPCLLYNAPQYAGDFAISAPVLRECAKHPNIVGIKDSGVATINRTLLEVDTAEFSVFSGSASTFFAALLSGAVGGVVSLGDYHPEAVYAFYKLIKAEDITRSTLMNTAISHANAAIAGKYGVAGVKGAMDAMGYYGGPPRLPLPPLDEEGRCAVNLAVERLVAAVDTILKEE